MPDTGEQETQKDKVKKKTKSLIHKSNDRKKKNV